MRGKAGHTGGCCRRNRITPAYAGKSWTTSARSSTSRDHPRLCGEKLDDLGTEFHKQGSPPPMRGKVVVAVFLLYSAGITPAYAGKSIRNFQIAVLIRDHPRLCGEKVHSRPCPGSARGSPPPMRGKDPAEHRHGRKGGITPAYAGKRPCR